MTGNHGLEQQLQRDPGAIALVVVDAQPTFMPGGELPVPDGASIVEPLVRLIRRCGKDLGLVVFSRDWHPADHCSFAETPRYTDGSWPPHGIAGTANAEVHLDLIAACQETGTHFVTISKGIDAGIEAYSAFDGLNLDSLRTLDEELREAGVPTILVAGLAGEICVEATVTGGVQRGFAVALFREGTGFLGDPEPTLERMRAIGVAIAQTDSANV